MQRFLAYLPDADAGEGGEALALIAEDLEWLLTADAGELWSVARADPSLLLLLASFLQHAKCVRAGDEAVCRGSAESASWLCLRSRRRLCHHRSTVLRPVPL